MKINGTKVLSYEQCISLLKTCTDRRVVTYAHPDPTPAATPAVPSTPQSTTSTLTTLNTPATIQPTIFPTNTLLSFVSTLSETVSSTVSSYATSKLGSDDAPVPTPMKTAREVKLMIQEGENVQKGSQRQHSEQGADGTAWPSSGSLRARSSQNTLPNQNPYLPTQTPSRLASPVAVSAPKPRTARKASQPTVKVLKSEVVVEASTPKGEMGAKEAVMFLNKVSNDKLAAQRSFVTQQTSQLQHSVAELTTLVTSKDSQLAQYGELVGQKDELIASYVKDIKAMQGNHAEQTKELRRCLREREESIKEQSSVAKDMLKMMEGAKKEISELKEEVS